jgi:transposase
MPAFPSAIKLYAAVAPVDMRKSFNGLWSAAQEKLGEDPKNGAIFIFINKDRTRLKLLYWDGTGVWVLAKRLEQGRFSRPAPSTAASKLSLAPEAFALLIGGVELRGADLKPWYQRT